MSVSEHSAQPSQHSDVSDRLRAVESDLAERQFVGRSETGSVAVRVTGEGALLDIAIADADLRGSHPGTIGSAIVAAVRAARAEATRHTSELMRRVLPAGPEPSREPVRRPFRTPRPADDGEDLFTGFRMGGTR